ncbi:glucuronate isomerase [Amphibacillus sediminis]|uniref:glucuronate isomerase n=1 Tax=Amphibacillus sediminis TaxID=360185 RepID=UPI000829BF13|nr:glucuronate isomerase [Amphibacillus sediminis]
MTFIDNDFLLQSEIARSLFHTFAEKLPIIDYHCHLSPKEIAENKSFKTITDLWLTGDHYKWRALRTFGVDEHYITGQASAKEKFQAWAKVVPKTVGNPLYHWTHLELKRYFDLDLILSEHNWEEVWEETNRLLQQDNFRAQQLIARSHVEVICTTDDPLADLVHHASIKKQSSFTPRVLPTLRPDRMLDISAPNFRTYLEKLALKYNLLVQDWASLVDLIEKMVNYFHDHGCRLADHGFQRLVYTEATEPQCESILTKALSGEALAPTEVAQYQTALLIKLAQTYHKKGWVMQLHLGAIRNNNERMLAQIGIDSGFDSIDDSLIAEPLNRLLNAVDRTDQLPKTIIYNLNPNQNEVIASTIGNFQGSGVEGKLQFGSGWWFNDQKRGIERQLNDLASIGFLSSFVGMLTDSRSFLSYTRHEYFRRVVANLVGDWAEQGLVPNDLQLLGQLITNISYHNAKRYFPF